MPLEHITDAKLRDDPSLKDFKTVDDLAKSYVEGRALLGAAIRVPGPDAGADAVAEFRGKVMKHVPNAIVLPDDAAERAKVEATVFEKLGRPKDAKEYSAPAGVELPDAALEALRKDAAEEGLTKGQFAARAKRAAEQLVKVSQAEKDELAQLKKELGEAFDERTAAARAIAEKLGVPKDAAAAMPARELRVWAAVAKAVGGETNQVGTQGTGAAPKLTPAEARLQADEIRQRLIREGTRMNPQVKQDLLDKMLRLEAAALVKAS
jgi:Asp-tRNA(Asn)/Glu-tRNA(Gln) amidotransferase C subunit